MVHQFWSKDKTDTLQTTLTIKHAKTNNFGFWKTAQEGRDTYVL